LARLATPAAGIQYEERLVLFIDFLGFKEIVGKTTSDLAALTRLIDALNDIGRIGEHDAFASQCVTQSPIPSSSGIRWLNAVPSCE
jgi:hypothetical protein